MDNTNISENQEVNQVQFNHSSDKNVYQRLAAVRRLVPFIEKKGKVQLKNSEHNVVNSEDVLMAVNAAINENGLLLIPSIQDEKYTYLTTGPYPVYLVILKMKMTWVNVDNPEDRLECDWEAYGTNAAADKAFGAALTYTEKYFILKCFNIATGKDDPDKQNQGSGKGSKGNKASNATNGQEQDKNRIAYAINAIATCNKNNFEKIDKKYFDLIALSPEYKLARNKKFNEINGTGSASAPATSQEQAPVPNQVTPEPIQGPKQEATPEPEKKPGKPTSEKSPPPSGSAGEQKTAGAEKTYTEKEVKEAIKAVDTCALDTEELRVILSQYPGLAGQSPEFKKTRDTKISIILNSQLEDFENKALECQSLSVLADLITQYPSLLKNDEYKGLLEECAESHRNRIRELTKITEMKEKERAKVARDAMKKEAISEFKFANGLKELTPLGEKWAALIKSSVSVAGEYEKQKQYWTKFETGSVEERKQMRAEVEARKQELLSKEEIPF